MNDPFSTRAAPPDARPVGPDRGGAEPLPLEARLRINEACDRFEASLRAGRRPSVEDFLGGAAAAERLALMQELLQVDIHYRRLRGEALRPADYLARFPELDPRWLAGAVEPPTLMDGSLELSTLPKPRPRSIRCPQCDGLIHLLNRGTSKVQCDACGNSFRLRDARETRSVSSRKMGKFRLLDPEPVGQGAFGAVWRAHDPDTDRVVALKIPHPVDDAFSAEDLEQFRDEARKAGRLHHPGIVTVYDVPAVDGVPIIVSQFIEGVSLRDLLEVRRPTFRQAARLAAEIVDALHYAHTQGLVHRDVKPGNVMVENPKPEAGRSGGPDDFGRPVLLDFGLALRQRADIVLTMEGTVVGTPAYMSPEQWAGKGHTADGRSDVFSVGVVLYELLCGELPFRGNFAMLRRQVQFDDPRPPRRINDRIPRDLETVCLKAMSKAPAQRYQTAAELAADLRRFLAGEPVHARRAGRLERLWSWCRRRPLDAALVGALVGLLALLAVGSTVAAVWMDQLRRRGDRLLDKAVYVSDRLDEAAREVVDNTPHMEGKEQQLMEDSLQSRIELLEDRSSPEDRKKLAQAHHQLGDLYQKVGKFEQAKDQYNRAIRDYEDLTKGDQGAEAADDWNDWAVAQDDLAELLRITAPADAPAHYEQAWKKQEKLGGDIAAKPEYRQGLALTCNNYGICLWHDGDRGRAKELNQEAIGLLTGLRDVDGGNPDYQADLARAYLNRGCWLFAESGGNAQKAIDVYYDPAIQILEDLKKKSTTPDYEYRFRLGLAYADRGDALRALGQFDDARKALRAATDLLGQLTEDFRQKHLYRKEYANALNTLGQTEMEATHSDAAERAWTQARAQFDELGNDPDLADLAEYRSENALNLQNVGWYLLRDKDPAKAESDLAQAVRVQRAVWESDPHNGVYFVRLRGHYYLHGLMLVKMGRHADAATEAETLLQWAKDDDEARWDAAGIFAECVPVAEGDKVLPPDQQSKMTADYLGRALKHLRDLPKGTKAAELDADTDFDAVRSRPAFEQLRAEWETREKGQP